MTSGNIAVFDHDVQQLVDLMAELNRRSGSTSKRRPTWSGACSRPSPKAAGRARYRRRAEVQNDDPLERGEGRRVGVRLQESICTSSTCPSTAPARSTKTRRAEDVRVVRECIEAVQPRQIYVAGDMTDPHGTHRVCTGLVFQALREIERRPAPTRRAPVSRRWQEWPHAIDVAVPSPRDQQRNARHLPPRVAERHGLVSSPDDPREFWQRAEDRNRSTADTYNQIGLPEYYAMEAFVRWDGRQP